VTSGGAASVVIGLGRRVAGSRCSGLPTAGLEPFRCDRLAAADARPERAVVESRQRLVHQYQLMVGAVAQGEVALLREDLAGRRGL
jgi:hypothetical protein